MLNNQQKSEATQTILLGKWINKLCSIHTIGYSTIKGTTDIRHSMRMLSFNYAQLKSHITILHTL